MEAKYIKLLRVTIKAISDYPFHSLLFFSGITLVGLTQVASIGSLYPIILTLLDQNTKGNALIRYFDKVLSLAGVTPGLLNYLLLFLIVSAVSALIYILLEIYQGFFLRRLEFNERYSLVQRVIYSKWSFLGDLNHGDFINAVAHEAEGYKVVIRNCFMLISSLAQIIFYGYFAFVVDHRIVILSIVLFIACAILLYPLMKKAMILGQQWTDAYSKLTDSLVSTTRAFKNIKAGSMESFVMKYIKFPIFRTSNVYFKQYALSAWQVKLTEFCAFIVLAVIIYYGVKIIGMKTTNLVLILVVYSRLVAQIRTAIDSFHRAYSTLPSIEKLQEIANRCEIQTNIKGKVLEGELRRISLKSVNFHYANNKSLFEGLTLEMKRGEFWAISGPTGIGKTTFLDLLARIVEPSSGIIYYNNIRHDEIDINTLHRRMGYLTQDHFIFAGTILENILWGSNNASKSEVDRVIRMAKLEDMLSEKKLNFNVSESGQNLSGGQRQRIAIARILLKNFDFILLDEPTSALDTETGESFISAMNNLKGEIGIVLVTHREEYQKFADHVLVIENGSVNKVDVHTSTGI